MKMKSVSGSEMIAWTKGFKPLQITQIVLVQMPTFIVIVMASLWLITQEWEYGYFTISALCNIIINQILKLSMTALSGSAPWTKRPKGATNCGTVVYPFNKKATSSGMPSGHAQFAGFLLVYSLLYLADEDDKSEIIRFIAAIFIGFICILIALHRTSFMLIGVKCHTYLQVFVGFLIGALIGLISYEIIKAVK